MRAITVRPLFCPRIQALTGQKDVKGIYPAVQSSLWELSATTTRQSNRNVDARGNFSRPWSSDGLHQYPQSEVQLTQFLAFKASLDQLIFVVDQHIDGTVAGTPTLHSTSTVKVWRRIDENGSQDARNITQDDRSPPNSGSSEHTGPREKSTAACMSTKGKNRPSLSSVQLCTIFHRLSKYGTRLKPRRQRELRENPTVAWLAAEIERLVKDGAFQGQALANIAWAHARFQHGSPSLMDSAAAACLQCLDSFRPLEVANLAHAFGSCSTSCDAHLARHLITSLTQHQMLGQLNRYHPRQVKEVMWAHTRLGLFSSPLYSEAAQSIQGRLNDCTPSDVAMMMWSFAKASFTCPELCDRVGPWAAQRIDELCPQDISNMLWALAKLECIQPMLMSAVSYHCSKSLRGFSEQSLSNIAWSYASLGVCDDTLLDAICREVITRITSTEAASASHSTWRAPRMVTAPASTIAATSSAMSSTLPSGASGTGPVMNGGVGIGGENWHGQQHQHQQHDGAHVANRGVEGGGRWRNGYPEQAVANVAWSLATLCHDSPHFFHSLARASAPSLHLFSGRSLACLSFAFAHMNYPLPLFFDGVEQEICRRLSLSPADSEFGRRSTVMLAWALVVAGRTALCLREGEQEQGQRDDALTPVEDQQHEQQQQKDQDDGSSSLYGADAVERSLVSSYTTSNSSSSSTSNSSSTSSSSSSSSSATATAAVDVPSPLSSPSLASSSSSPSSSFRGCGLPILRQHLLEHAEAFTSKELCQLYQVELAIELEWPELNQRMLEAAKEREQAREKQGGAGQSTEGVHECTEEEGEEGEGRGKGAAVTVYSGNVSSGSAKEVQRISAHRPSDPSAASSDLPSGEKQPSDPHPVESSEPGRYLQHLWLTGFVRSRAKACWDAAYGGKESHISTLHADVAAVLEQMGVRHVHEYRQKDYSVDMAVFELPRSFFPRLSGTNEQDGADGGIGATIVGGAVNSDCDDRRSHVKVRIAVEVDGPSHFTATSSAMPHIPATSDLLQSPFKSPSTDSSTTYLPSTSFSSSLSLPSPTFTPASLQQHQPLGPTLLKARLLQRLGWQVVQVPFFEWSHLATAAAKAEYIERKFTAAAAMLLPAIMAAEEEARAAAVSTKGDSKDVTASYGQSDAVNDAEVAGKETSQVLAQDRLRTLAVARVLKSRVGSLGMPRSSAGALKRPDLVQHAHKLSRGGIDPKESTDLD